MDRDCGKYIFLRELIGLGVALRDRANKKLMIISKMMMKRPDTICRPFALAKCIIIPMFNTSPSSTASKIGFVFIEFFAMMNLLMSVSCSLGSLYPFRIFFPSMRRNPLLDSLGVAL